MTQRNAETPGDAGDGSARRLDATAAWLPTRYGRFRAVVVDAAGGGLDCLAAIAGDPGAVDAPLVRLHSECLTGDALGSLRCDCGEQLERALSAIGAAGTGVLLYLRQEGRGVGLANKIRAYALQDRGADTVDANVALGLPVDGRDYAGAAGALRRLGITRVRLLTNNPHKCSALEAHGVTVVERLPLPVDPNPYNAGYLRTKRTRMGHLIGEITGERGGAGAVAASELPAVTLHYAQSIDGRIATRTGQSRWLSGEATLRLQHELRAAHGAVVVGVGTVIADDPRLTVRLCEGASPLRVVVDSGLRIPAASHLLGDGAPPTLVATTRRATPERIAAVRAAGAEVVMLPEGDGGVDLRHLLAELRRRGVESVLVEGGGRLITSLLRGRLVSRAVVCITPKFIGSGVDAVGDIAVTTLGEALQLQHPSVRVVGDDIVVDGALETAPVAVAAG